MTVSPLAALVVGLAMGAGLGWVFAYLMGRAEVQRLQALRVAERTEADKAIARLRKELSERESASREQAEAIQLLPETLSEMFLAGSRRSITALALRLVQQVLLPEQVALFVARPAQGRLVLTTGSGLPPKLAPGTQAPYGEGRIGFVAETRVAMDDADFRSAAGTKVGEVMELRRHLESSGILGLRADVVAPILVAGQLFGVLCAGTVRARRGKEKRLLSMIAELTGVALTHARRLQEAEEAASRDGLTGVLNRANLEQRLTADMETAADQGRPLSVILLDIDHLEHYNLTNSNLDGDGVVKEVARLLRDGLREDDYVGRTKGGEFALVCPGAPKEVALRLADTLRRSVESYPFPHRGQQPLGTVTVSGGVATFPDDSRHPADLLRLANDAMFDAKAEGRNRIQPAQPGYLG